MGSIPVHEWDAYNATMFGELVWLPSGFDVQVLVCGGGVQDLKSHGKQGKPTLHLR
jgi:hypothetical protein